MNNVKRNAIVGAVAMGLVSGILGQLMTVIAILQTSFCELHGYSATQFSVAISLYSGAGIVAGILLGKLVSSLGIKKLAFISALAPLVALIGMRFSSSIILTYVFGFLGGLLVGFTTTAVLNMYIGSWFNKGKGTMNAVGQTLASLCAIVFVPLVTNIMVKTGAEKAPIIVAVIMSATALVAAFLVKGMPAEYGVQPVDLAEKEKKASSSSAAAVELYDVQMPAKNLLKKLPVLAALLMSFLAIVALAMFGTYAVYIYDSFIGDMVTASYYVSISSACAMVFAMLFGVLCDKVGVMKSVIIYGLLAGLSKIIAPSIGGNVGALLVAIINGTQVFATMYIGVAFPMILGYKSMATVAGWASSLMSAGGMVAPVLAMALVTANGGSYNLVVYVTGALLLICMLLGVFCITKKSRESMKKSDMEWLAANSNN